MISTCQAAVLETPGQPLVIKTLEIPPLVAGQVLVKVQFSGVCRSQLMEVRGLRGRDPWLPHLLGHEGSGTVIALGAGVRKVQPGDGVILGWLQGVGLDAPGAQYRCGDQRINAGKVTTFGNYSVVSESRLVVKPAGLAMDTAVLYGCALPTGAGMVLNELRPKPTQTVVVLGLGGIGMSALLTLKALGLSNLIAVDVADDKLAWAWSMGASHIFNSNSAGFHQALMALTQGGADLCVESAGLVSTIELGFSLIKKNGGKLLFASHPPHGQMIQLAPHELISGKQIAGSWGGASAPDTDVARMHALFESQHISVQSMLSQRYALDQINTALDDLEAGRVFRPLIVMQHP